MDSTERARKWRQNNPEANRRIAQRYARNTPGRIVRFRRDQRFKNPARRLFLGVRDRARRLGIPFNITQDDIVIPAICPVLGMPIITNVLRHQHGPSVDKVIPELGYTKGNVVVMSMHANRLKSNGTLWEFERLVEFLRQRKGTGH